MNILNLLMFNFAVVGLTLIILGLFGISNLSSCPLTSVKQIFTSTISIGAVLLSIAIGFSLCKNTCGVCTPYSISLKVYMLALACILSGIVLFTFSYLITNTINKNTNDINCKFNFTSLPLILKIIGSFQLLVGFVCVIIQLKNTKKIKGETIQSQTPPVQKIVPDKVIKTPSQTSPVQKIVPGKVPDKVINTSPVQNSQTPYSPYSPYSYFP